jgi:superfamily I DNA/RNA helicase
VAWSSVGIDVRGRSTRLTVNYRTTDQIRRFSDRLLPDAIESDDGESAARTTLSLLRGPAPDLKGFVDVEREVAGVAKWIQAHLKEDYEPGDFALFARTEALLEQRARKVLERLHLEGHALDDEDDPPGDRPVLGTMHRAKGLEFKVVVVMGADSGHLPLPAVVNGAVDDADREALIEQERNLLYVACTRARDRLLVSWVGKPSTLLGNT